MLKAEYYKISKEQKLPLRCPCLSTCARYRFTAFLIGKMSYHPRTIDIDRGMQEMGILNSDESIDTMLVAGEPVEIIGGSRSFYIREACPEFFLHRHEHKDIRMKSVAVHEYSFDEEYREDKFRPGESRHYTECAEYSFFSVKKSISKNRKRISLKIRAELQQEIDSKCPFCLDKQVGHFHVHHIDENPENNNHENLLMVCPTCHSKITKGDIQTKQVKQTKSDLLNGQY